MNENHDQNIAEQVWVEFEEKYLGFPTTDKEPFHKRMVTWKEHWRRSSQKQERNS
jgi:hypothetical protein